MSSSDLKAALEAIEKDLPFVRASIERDAKYYEHHLHIHCEISDYNIRDVVRVERPDIVEFITYMWPKIKKEILIKRGEYITETRKKGEDMRVKSGKYPTYEPTTPVYSSGGYVSSKETAAKTSIHDIIKSRYEPTELYSTSSEDEIDSSSYAKEKIKFTEEYKKKAAEAKARAEAEKVKAEEKRLQEIEKRKKEYNKNDAFGLF